MHSLQKGFSLIVVCIFCTQPVLANEPLSLEATLIETTIEQETTEILPETTTLVEHQDGEILFETVTSTPHEFIVTERPSIEAFLDQDAVAVSSKDVNSAILEKNFFDDVSPLEYVADQILVEYKGNKINLETKKGERDASRFANAKSLVTVGVLEEKNVVLFEIDESKTVLQMIRMLKGDPNVAHVQPNFQYAPATINTTDTHRNLLWGLESIDAPEAWIVHGQTLPATVIVAIIDTGVAYNHPDLLPNMWNGSMCVDENGDLLSACNHGYDYEEDDTTPLPSYSLHGTHIAGIIAAVKNNDLGVIGVAPQAKIMAIKSDLTTFDNVRSIHFAEHNGARVINASWVGTGFDQQLYNAIATFPGLFVAAAGNELNDNDTEHRYPSDFDLPNIISVAATDETDELAPLFSNYGAISVDVAAPGTNIYSTVSSEMLFLSENFDTLTSPDIPNGWVQHGFNNNWGTLSVGGGDTVLYADLATPYADNADTFMTSSAYDVRNGGANLSFLTSCDTEYNTDGWGDYLQLEYSADGVNFMVATDTYSGEAFRWDEATLDFRNGAPFGDNPFGSGYFYTHVAIPTQYLTENFKFQFHWITNATDNDYYGCLVDEVKIIKLSDGSDEPYAFLDGTSMAVPHVAGLVALIQGYAPHLPLSQIKNIILTQGDSLPSLSGTTVSGKRINVHNALQYVWTLKTIDTFTIPTQTGVTTIDEIAHTITLTVPFGTNVVSLTPTFTFTGSSTNLDSGTAQDFTSPISYIVTAMDASIQEYMVTVVVAAEIVSPLPSSGGGGGGSGKKSSKATYSIVINNDAPVTTSSDVELTLARVKGATEVQISNTSNFKSSVWVPFTSTFSWKLTSGSGTKRVYVQYGNDGKILGSAEDRIILKELSPSFQIQLLPSVSPEPRVSGTTLTPISRTRFTTTLSLGSRSQEVIEIQKILIADGYLTIHPPTGYYGPITLSAVRAYQSAHGLPVTGIVDTDTRSLLNGGLPLEENDGQKALLIVMLQAKLQELILELKAMQAR